MIDWYQSTLLSRLNDPQTGPIVLIQQRLHEADLAGVLLGQGGWTHLDLPAIAEDNTTVELGWRGCVHRQEGDLLHPTRLPRDLLDRRRAELGSYVFAAQYQQQPAPLGGGLIKWDWFQRYDRKPVSVPKDQIVQSWDTASKADEANDFSVCTTWLVRDSGAWLLDIYRARLEFPAGVAKKQAGLGHRERQIVEAVYRLGEASVGEVRSELTDPPSYSTVRAMLGTLTEKRVLRFRRDGKRYLYRPTVDAEVASQTALSNLLATFFGGRTSDAVAALLDVSGDDLSDDELKQIKRLVEERRQQNRSGTKS